jgi:hypothetical protein
MDQPRDHKLRLFHVVTNTFKTAPLQLRYMHVISLLSMLAGLQNQRVLQRSSESDLLLRENGTQKGREKHIPGLVGKTWQR